MVIYTQNSSQINITNQYNQSEPVIIQGNNNQVQVSNCNCVIQLMGNGNIVIGESLRVRLEVAGNGNQVLMRQSRVEVTVMGNANEFKSEAEIEPVQVNECRGFGNTLPENAVNKQPAQRGNKNVGHQQQMNYLNNQSPFLMNQFQSISLGNPYQQSQRYNSRMSPYSMPPNNNIFTHNNNHQSSRMMNEQDYDDDMLGYDDEEDDEFSHQGYQASKNQTQRLRAQQLVQQQARKAQEEARRVQFEMQRKHQEQKRRAMQQQRMILEQNRRAAQQQIRQARQQGRIQQEQARRVKQQKRRQHHEQNLRRQNMGLRQQLQARHGQWRPNQGANLFGDMFGANNQHNPHNNNRHNHNHNSSRQNDSVRKEEDEERGLEKEQLKRLISHSYTGPEQDCMICFMGLQYNDESTFLHCFHSFHSYCINTWLQKCSKCPICNDNVRKNL